MELEKQYENKDYVNVWPQIPWKLPHSVPIFEEWLQVMLLPIGWFYILVHLIGFIFAYLEFSETSTLPAIGISFAISAVTITMLRLLFTKVEDEKNSLSIPILLRFYLASAIGCNIFLIGMKYSDITIFGWALAGLISFYFLFRKGTIHDKLLKAIWIWPLKESTEEKVSTKMHRIDQMLWFLRTISLMLALGACKKIFATTGPLLEVTLGAGLHEEAFKFLLTGAILIIPKYSPSRITILYVSFIIGLGFDLTESVMYCIQEPNSLSRFIHPFIHSAFNFFIALAISRQRETFLWWVELIVGVILSTGIHALNNFAAVHSLAGVMIFILALPWSILFFLLLLEEPYPLKIGNFWTKQTRSEHEHDAGAAYQKC